MFTYSNTIILFSGTNSFELPFAKQYDKKYFKVHCHGPCQGVTVSLSSSNGDPDLYASETSQPCEQTTDDVCSCTHCLCESTEDIADDVCGNIITSSSSFFVTVFAFEDCAADGTKATIVFKNVKYVMEFRK